MDELLDVEVVVDSENVPHADPPPSVSRNASGD
jgi:hypothetical protein